MYKAYIILAHKYPDQLLRLVSRLNDGASHFFIHIDKKAHITQFAQVFALTDIVDFISREDSKWAGFDIVQATLNGMKAVKESHKKFDRIILLSGQDYPIKSNRDIDQFFRSSPHSVFLDYFPIPNYKKWPGGDRGGWYRVDKYYIGLKSYQLFCSKSINLLATFFPFLRRKMPGDMKPYTGSQWWCMDMYALGYILDYTKAHPEYVSFHKHTFAPDELFFHMILVNSKDENLISSIENNNKRFMTWEVSDSAHPNTICATDFEAIAASDHLFARKFDATVDNEIMDLIDARILQDKQVHHSKDVLFSNE
ncbi:MAG: putative glycosyl transferase [Flavisolibacter sp.]|nr:putative glycosyl transferase [Flavisolibacter sp.]